MADGRGPQLWNVRLNDRAPARQPVEPQAYRHPLTVVDGEHLRGVTIAGSEESCAWAGESDAGLPLAGEEVGVNRLPVGEQGLPTRHRGPSAHEKDQTGRIRRARTLRVRIQAPVAESGEARSVHVAAGVADGGKAVRVTVAVRYEVHDPGGEGPHRVA